MGDPARNVLLKSVIDTVEKDGLLKRTQKSGAALIDGFKDLQVSEADTKNSRRRVSKVLSL